VTVCIRGDAVEGRRSGGVMLLQNSEIGGVGGKMLVSLCVSFGCRGAVGAMWPPRGKVVRMVTEPLATK
jgi:hypothetical protein